MKALHTASILIRRPAAAVYAYMNDPQNLPRWSLFITAVRRVAGEDGEWEATSQAGTSRMRFEATNTLGVLDHWVRISPEQTVYVPLRVVAHDDGSCAVLFTVFRLPEMDDA